MLVNSSLTIYHQNGLDVSTHLEKWTRHNYDKVWIYGGQGARFNKGIDEANDVQVRIPYDLNKGLDINDFAIDDIIVQGTLDINIETPDDLSNYLTFKIASITDNRYGNNQHIHLGGK